MKTDEIRELYLDFYVSKGHRLCASDVLVPTWDKTVLFTPAGMNPFKDHFLGNVELEFTRATSCQKCLRTGDIENVGRTAYHHTFFEMLGNFSFGDYFKRDAIHWAWEFLTEQKWLNIDKDKLTVTVYLDDDEAADIWHKDVGLSLDRIERMDEYENFWPAGAPSDGPDGVCGPCSEIFYHPNGIGKGNDVEIWNLVFTQFNRKGSPPDNLSPLPNKNIDTGMGLERIAATLQGVDTNFHIDILKPVVDAAADITGIKYDPDQDTGRFLRRISDHVRACSFAIHENVYPGSGKAEYVVRRLLRRCTFEGRQLGHQEPFLYKLVPAIAQAMSRPYPEITESCERIQQVIKLEENSFLDRLDDGIVRIDRMFETMTKNEVSLIDGKEAFDLYQTYGIPAELIESIGGERNFKFDWSSYQQAEQQHAVDSGKGGRGVMGDFGPIDQIKKEVKSTRFLGYDACETSATVVGLVCDQSRTTSVQGESTEVQVVLDQSPFYATSGGQEADHGRIVSDHCEIQVTSVEKSGDVIVHSGTIRKGEIAEGDQVQALVDVERRNALRRAHTATHILHYSLQQTLGSHAQQRGSKVDDDWLRFDFANLEPVSEDELDKIEQMTIQKIGSGSAVAAEVLSLTAAKDQGAMMLFGEKYPDPVRMVSIGEFSKELCGGTHLDNSSDVGQFEVCMEESVSAGTRRIEAVTGKRAEEAKSAVCQTMATLVETFNVQPSRVRDAFDNLVSEVKELKKRIHSGNQHEISEKVVTGGEEISYYQQRSVIRSIARSLNISVADIGERVQSLIGEKSQLLDQHQAMGRAEQIDADMLIEAAESIGDTRIIVRELSSSNPNLMRQLIDQIRKKVNPVGVFLATSPAADKVVLVAGVSKDLVENGIKAGDWVKEVAPVVGGGGGGKPDMAQAGGKHPEKIAEALESARSFLVAKINGS